MKLNIQLLVLFLFSNGKECQICLFIYFLFEIIIFKIFNIFTKSIVFYKNV